MQFFRRSAVSVAATTFAFAAISWFSAGDALAQRPAHPLSLYSGYGYGRAPYSSSIRRSYGYSAYGYSSYGSPRYSGPIYHAPSVHLDYEYHPEYLHWTPGRGLHAHGHYDAVPHYTPGHFDQLHGNHIHGNPHFDH